MIHYLEAILKKRRNILHKFNLLMKISFILVAAFIFSEFTSNDVKAASGLKLYDYTSKKTMNYTDQLVKVTYNGAVIGNSNTPGIIVNGIAILPYDDIFLNSSITADCKYSQDNGTISISKYGIFIEMKIGIKLATVNGKAVTMPAAPRKLKYKNNNKVKLLVPSRFISETLGLKYTWISDKNTVAIENHNLDLSFNNGDRFKYSGAQGKVTIDGKEVNLDPMPSVITNNTAMLRAKKVFADSKIAAGYVYDKKNRSITLSKDDKVLVMTLGSTKALLNNKELKLETAPLLVTNHETDTSYIMVPGSITASSLGYDYTWNNKTRTSVISTRAKNTTADNIATSPELGDSDVVNDTGTVLNNWTATEGAYYNSLSVHELDSGSESSGVTGNIYYAARDFSYSKLNAETYIILSTTPFSKVTASNLDKIISIKADNLSCTEQTSQLFPQNSNYVNTMKLYKSKDGTGSKVELELMDANYHYDISLSPDKLILYVTVSMNSMTSAVIGVNSVGDYLTLTGASPLKPDITVESNLMMINLPYTVNCVGDITSIISGTKYINQIITSSSLNQTQITLQLNEGYTYYMLEAGNQYTISFQGIGGVEQTADNTDIADSTDITDTPQMPIAEDISKYEIIIPKPEEVAWNLVSNEDFYFDHYFEIRLPGDYKAYYDAKSITKKSKAIDQISVSTNNQMETVIKIATTKLQGYEIAFDDSNIYVHIGNPRDIYKNIVVLDPGHGGGANGAQYYGSNEKDINLKILYTLGKKYFNSDTSKLKVYYTRTSDVDMPLSERAAFVKKVGADLFVSLHMNASEATYVSGTEVFYSKKNNAANAAGLTSQRLASFLVSNLVNTLGTSSRGVKEERYTVIYKNTVPAVLIELGFLSNKNEYAILTDEEIQRKAAKTIYETLLQVFEEYPTGR